MGIYRPNHEKKNKKCFWNLHGFNESDKHCKKHDDDESESHCFDHDHEESEFILNTSIQKESDCFDHHHDESESHCFDHDHEESEFALNTNIQKESDCFDHHHEASDDHGHHESCVGEVLEAILHAQEKAKKHHNDNDSCTKESISTLLEEKKRSKKNIIPFILYNEDSEPFKGSGVAIVKNHHTNKKKFSCISSFIFKIKDLNDGCAVLELLTFKPECRSNNDQKSNKKNPCSPCCQIDHKDVDDLIGTGICITVDLSCFCAISTLPAVSLKR